jgi:hypothetical protein
VLGKEGKEMNNKIIFETAQEVVKAFGKTRYIDDKFPILPEDAQLIFEADLQCVRLQAAGFELDSSVDAGSVILAIADAANVKIIIT